MSFNCLFLELRDKPCFMFLCTWQERPWVVPHRCSFWADRAVMWPTALWVASSSRPAFWKYALVIERPHGELLLSWMYRRILSGLDKVSSSNDSSFCLRISFMILALKHDMKLLNKIYHRIILVIGKSWDVLWLPVVGFCLYSTWKLAHKTFSSYIILKKSLELILDSHSMGSMPRLSAFGRQWFCEQHWWASGTWMIVFKALSFHWTGRLWWLEHRWSPPEKNNIVKPGCCNCRHRLLREHIIVVEASMNASASCLDT